MGSERFVRQSSMFTEQEQQKLFNTKVAVVGCGGLGSQVIANLVSAGIRRFILADGDRVSESNLNRQFIHFGHLGQYKTDSAEQWILRADWRCSVVKNTFMLAKDNAESVLNDADVVADCLDTPESRKILAESCRRLGKVLVHAGVESEYGQVCVFRPDSAVEMESVLLKKAGTGTSYSPVVSVIGAVEADQVIRAALGRDGVLYDTLLAYDGVSHTFSKHGLRARKI